MIRKSTYRLVFFIVCFTAFGLSGASGSEPGFLINKAEYQPDTVIDTTEVFNQAHRSLFLSNKENNEAGVISAYLDLARFHELYGQLDSAIYYFGVLKDIYKKAGNNIAVAESCLEINGLYSSKAAYADAMEQVYEALDLYEAEQNQKGIALCYTHICDLLYYEDKYDESVEYADMAIAIQKEVDAKKDLAISYRYKASSLLFIDGKLEHALETINKAIDIYTEEGETGVPLLASMNGRGNIFKYMERYDEAIEDYYYIYVKTLELGLDRYTIPSIANIGHVYVMQEKYEEALPYILEAINLIMVSGNTKNLWENYMHAADIYEGLDDFKNANDYNKLYSIEYSKYLFTIIDRLESEAQIKYETAKKDETINVQESKIEEQGKIQLLYISIAALLIISLVGMILSRKKIKKKQLELEESKEELQQSLENLKSTQTQLIHAEKMASLGDLTAGIAHEIQNPLNFVNNFSEVSNELIVEMKEELATGNMELAKDIADDVKQNLEIINHHGKRADAIVKGMLQHSRSSTGQKEKTDINVIADEYLRLAYHGLRAKDHSFNATLNTDFDESIGDVNVVAQDIGRVLLNLITNAFYACAERSRSACAERSRSMVSEALAKKTAIPPEFEPTVSVITKMEGDRVIISVKDNGNGIPQHVLDKIFQPFFTTKPTGEGTGLGLSLSYDIIKAHGGELSVETKEGEGAEFVIQLPV